MVYIKKIVTNPFKYRDMLLNNYKRIQHQKSNWDNSKFLYTPYILCKSNIILKVKTYTNQNNIYKKCLKPNFIRLELTFLMMNC